MTAAVKAFPFTVVSHVLAMAALIMVLIWTIHFRGGLAWEAANKNLIFNALLAVGNSALGFLEKLTFLESSGLAKYGTEAFLVNFTAITTVIFAVFVILSVISKPSSAEEDDHGAHSAK